MSEHGREFVVQRSKWLRGGKPHTFLLDGNGHMCCLGFVAAQCGVADNALRGVGAPRDIEVEDVYRQLQGVLIRQLATRVTDWTDSALADEAMTINDDSALTDAEREAQLTALFADHGYALRFEP